MPPLATDPIDSSSAAPSGTPCPACGTPVEPLDKFCPACRTPLTPPSAATKPGPVAASSEQASAEILDAQLAAPSPLSKFFRCQQCGAEVATDPNQRSYVCPFCDSTVVIEFSPEQTGRQDPEFVIGFAVTPDQAHAKFNEWLKKNSWFRPGDLATASVADKLKGVYLPFWSFTMLAQSGWSAQIGEYWYRTETYTTTDSKGNVQTHTRQVRETEWWPLTGYHHRYYSGYLVSGSRGLAQDQSLRIQPFQLPALKRYEPFYLAGWLAEEYSVAREDALQICQAEFQNQERANIAAFLPGDTHGSVQAQTRFSQVSSDLCLLPIYILSYRYQNKIFRFLCNGQTGKFSGDKPLSTSRIALAITAAVILLLILALIIFFIANAH